MLDKKVKKKNEAQFIPFFLWKKEEESKISYLLGLPQFTLQSQNYNCQVKEDLIGIQILRSHDSASASTRVSGPQ